MDNKTDETNKGELLVSGFEFKDIPFPFWNWNSHTKRW